MVKLKLTGKTDIQLAARHQFDLDENGTLTVGIMGGVNMVAMTPQAGFSVTLNR